MPHGGLRHPNVVFIDTNLLLLLLVGALDVDQVERFKRTRAYSRDDYALLTAFVASYGSVMATPNVLTEVSNFTGQLGEPLRRKAFLALRLLISRLNEQYVASRDAAQHTVFLQLGLADTSVFLSAKPGVTVLTDDLPLYARLSSAGVNAINFNHLRSGSW